MLFNSYEFILVFLPAVLWAYYQLGKTAIPQLSIALLIGASLFFYAWWNPAYLTLLVASMLINYAFGIALSRKPKRLYLTLGVTINLVALGYYKYSNFFIDNLNVIANTNFHLEQVILPLAISFFTFQQIAFLVDAYKNEAHEYQFLDYCLFVSFFPQLIAGPIVHHKEMMPQFQSFPAKNINYENLSTGLAIFIIGLAKKVLIADNLAPYANETFAAAGNGVSLSFLEAWKGAFAYTFQLYFDFSGYSDMAIGLALMFGIRLPINFNSPYKATNIIEFWRCWHMTLSRFLRDYIYFPLGGNRHGQIRRYTNLLITMLLGGLWHGAAWTFVFWGFLHGIFLAVNHAWHAIQRKI
ncbi:MAG: MBOAT family protein, partial [Gammaproteobacteria bacterium]|nr:MBOAT family protein [Gammaproteobacteria bacterium]